MRENFSTFRPELQGVKNIKTIKRHNSYDVYCVRIDKRPKCCNRNPHIKDYRTVKIIMPSHSRKRVTVYAKKQRYVCPVCHKIINTTLEFVDKRHTISKEVKSIIKKDLKIMKSQKEIAKENFVSTNTVGRILKEINIEKIRKRQLDTSIIYIDEFKGNTEKEKYQLAIYDKNRTLVDILKNRKTKTILEYLSKYKIRPNIVVTDMFKPFRSLIKKHFPNTKIVADKYHVVRQVMWFLRDVRIQLFNSDKDKYKDLKRYWKLLTINTTKTKLTQKQEKKLKELLNLNIKLKKSYYIVKKFHKIIEMKNPLSFEKRLNEIIERLAKLEIPESNKIKTTLESWKKEIANIVKYNINNGFVEGNNNKIKVIKRISYGLRNYDNFRKLIFLRLT